MTFAEEIIEDEFHFTGFLKELRVLLRKDQINIDCDDCEDRGKPANSYHKSEACPQVTWDVHEHVVLK